MANNRWIRKYSAGGYVQYMQPFCLLLLKAKLYVGDILGEAGFSRIGLESDKVGAVGLSKWRPVILLLPR